MRWSNNNGNYLESYDDNLTNTALKRDKTQTDKYAIRIYHECEGKIEKSVLRIAVWHHEACRVMTNGDPEGRIFLSYPHTNNGFFFLAHQCFYLFIYFILK